MSELAAYEKHEGYGTIVMNDGKANVMSVQMLASLRKALDQAEAAGKPVILTGSGKLFSGGFDLGVFQQGKQPLFDMLKAGAELTERMLSFPCPLIIACNGHAVAMGVFVLLGGDYRIGVEGAFKIQANEVAIGLTLPRFAVETCRQRIAPAHFTRVAALAEAYSPEGAIEAGFLDEVVPKDELMTRAIEKAKSFGPLNMDAHKATKLRVRADNLKALRRAIAADIEEWTSAYA